MEKHVIYDIESLQLNGFKDNDSSYFKKYMELTSVNKRFTHSVNLYYK